MRQDEIKLEEGKLYTGRTETPLQTNVREFVEKVVKGDKK